ncbi:glycerol-3-phosphate 1-O-acyltransferase PlsY [soil metagenome]
MNPGLDPLLIAAAVAGYLVGSIPFGVLITRMAGLGDVRAIGSGNIGATNVLRTGRRDLALATLLLDGGKGALAVLFARALWGEEAAVVAGAAAFIGHIFPVWLKFRGGKGVATFFGVMIAAFWPVGLAAGATWIVAAAVFRYSSLAALAAAILAPAYAIAFHEPRRAVLLALLMAALIVLRHRANIVRLSRRQEPKIGAKKDAASTPPPAEA